MIFYLKYKKEKENKKSFIPIVRSFIREPYFACASEPEAVIQFQSMFCSSIAWQNIHELTLVNESPRTHQNHHLRHPANGKTKISSEKKLFKKYRNNIKFNVLTMYKV